MGHRGEAGIKLTRFSLYYLASYLFFAGVALVFAPNFALQLLLSNGDYGDVMPRLLGVVLFALGVVIAQIIRLRVEALYSTTVFVRFAILAVVLGLFVYSGDPFFLSLLAIVGLGVILTGTSYLLDRRNRKANSKP